MNNKKRPAGRPAEEPRKAVSQAMTEDERLELIRTVAALRRRRMKDMLPLQIPERR